LLIEKTTRKASSGNSLPQARAARPGAQENIAACAAATPANMELLAGRQISRAFRSANLSVLTLFY
jgi:hypothetical protein